MIRKIAFLLLFVFFLSASVFAEPAVTPGGPYSGARNTNIDLNGYATDDTGVITNIIWSIPGTCTMVNEFIFVSGDQNVDNAVITCTDIISDSVTLSADNNYMENTAENAALEIQNQGPSVVLEVEPDSGNPGVEVTLSGSCSDPDGNTDLKSCFLDYGDGNSELIAGPPYNFVETHKYYTIKTYQVKLIAQDSQDTNAQNIETVTVSPPAAPTITNKSPEPGSSVNDATPTVSFDIEDQGNGVNIGSLLLFVDNELRSYTTEESNGDYSVSWTFSSDQGSGHTAQVGLSVEDNQGNSTGDVNWQFRVDTEAPNIDDISIADGDSYTNDTTPTISLSGVSGSPNDMRLSCNGSNWKGWQGYDDSFSNFSLTTSDYGCPDGDDGGFTVYLVLRDSAGNWSSVVSDDCTLDRTKPATPDDLSGSIGDGEVTLSWDSVSDSSGIDFYKIYVDNSYRTSTSDDDTDKTITGLSNGREYEFEVSAVDNAGNEGSKSDELELTPSSEGGTTTPDEDTSPPILNWKKPDSGDTVSGVVRLIAESYDNQSGIRLVMFYVDGNRLKTLYSGVNQLYTYDWNSETVVDGKHTLKALAINGSGNDASNDRIREITVTTDNGIAAPKSGDLVGEAIEGAEEERERVARFIAEAVRYAVEASDEVEELLDEAGDLLGEADALYSDGNFDAAGEKADEAKEKLDELLEIFSVENYGSSQVYVYSAGQLGGLLQGIGLQSELAEEAEAVMGDFTVNRSIACKKVVDGESSYYKAVVRLVVKNNSSESKELQVLEVVPKGFAERAGLLESGNGFIVVADDPVIKWQLQLAGKQRKEISYTLKEDLNKGDADALLDSAPMQLFAAPPILLGKETAVSAASFGAAVGGTGAAGFLALGDLLSWLTWIVVAIIVIAIALFAFNRFRGRKEERPFGLHSVTQEKKGFSVFGKIGRGKREEEHGPKWAYKGD